MLSSRHFDFRTELFPEQILYIFLVSLVLATWFASHRFLLDFTVIIFGIIDSGLFRNRDPFAR